MGISTHWFAARGSFQGSIPMVVPPPSFAPKQAPCITPPSPPHTTVAPRLASSNPTRSAASVTSAVGLPAPITEIITLRTHSVAEYKEDSIIAKGAVSRGHPYRSFVFTAMRAQDPNFNGRIWIRHSAILQRFAVSLAEYVARFSIPLFDHRQWLIRAMLVLDRDRTRAKLPPITLGVTHDQRPHSAPNRSPAR